MYPKNSAQDLVNLWEKGKYGLWSYFPLKNIDKYDTQI